MRHNLERPTYLRRIQAELGRGYTYQNTPIDYSYEAPRPSLARNISRFFLRSCRSLRTNYL